MGFYNTRAHIHTCKHTHSELKQIGIENSPSHQLRSFLLSFTHPDNYWLPHSFLNLQTETCLKKVSQQFPLPFLKCDVFRVFSYFMLLWVDNSRHRRHSESHSLFQSSFVFMFYHPCLCPVYYQQAELLTTDIFPPLPSSHSHLCTFCSGDSRIVLTTVVEDRFVSDGHYSVQNEFLGRKQKQWSLQRHIFCSSQIRQSSIISVAKDRNLDVSSLTFFIISTDTNTHLAPKIHRQKGC